MRAILVAVLVAGAACNDPPGLTIEVIPSDPSVTEVQLFIGQDCHDCPSAMAPPGLLARSTDLYLNNDMRVFTGQWHGDRAGFRLLSSIPPKDETISVVIAVGFDANHTALETATLHGVQVPAGGAQWWQVHLEPATPIHDPPSTADGERIAIWPATRNGPQCLMVEHGSSGADTIVPADDTDCDGVSASLECAPFTPNAVRQPPLLAGASCVRPVASNISGSICLLGGPVCNEAGPSTTLSCEPLDVDYCAPSALCNACGVSGGTSGNWDTCVRAALATFNTTGGVAVVGCSVPMQASGMECPDPTNLEATLDASAYLSRDNGNNVKCSNIEISEPTLPLSFKHSLPVAGATLTLKDFQQDCKVTVEWSGNYTGTADNHVLVADLELTNGKHLVVPFVVHASFSCDNAMACGATMPDAGDTMFQCTRAAPTTTTCTGTTLCLGGTACGARCCLSGEACVDGVCQCGDGPHCLDDDKCSGGGLPGGCGVQCCGTTPCP